MDYVKLGGTGLDVSRLCLGMMSYGDPEWRPWVLPERDAWPLVRRAVEAGICRSEGVAVIPWSPLARGWLARPAGGRPDAGRCGASPTRDRPRTPSLGPQRPRRIHAAGPQAGSRAATAETARRARATEPV